MNTGTAKRALGLVLLYIGVFVAIVFIQFARSPGFLARSGRLSVSATWASSDRKGAPANVRIQYAGLSFELSAARPALVRSADGQVLKVLPSAVEKIDGGARILLAGGGEIRAVSDATSAQGFRLSATRPRSDSVALVLPCTLSGSAKLSGSSGKASLDMAGGPFTFSLPPTALDAGAKSLTLSFSDDASVAALVLKKAAAPAAPTQTPAAAQAAKVLPQAPMDPEAYKAAISAWDSRVWLGLSSGRWDGAGLGWKDVSGATVFSEKALVTYLAEAASKGLLPDALVKMRPAAKAGSSSLSWFSTPFLGDTVARMEVREGRDLAEVKRLYSLLEAKDPAILDDADLVPFLLDRAPYSQAQETFRFVTELDPAKLPVSGLVGYLEGYNAAASLMNASDNPFGQAEAAATRLVGAITKAQEGWFLKTADDGSSDLSLSIRAGRALADYGQSSSKDMVLGVGQSLVTSALALADQNGVLPSKVLPRSASASETSGSLFPETIYPVVVDNPYYPHERSFYRELGPGVWTWTSSPSIAVAATSASCIFTVSYPTGIPHYMAIYGLKPFSNIRLYGIDYSPDAAFESYDVSGYLFRKASNALYLKMKHKQDSEKIELYY
jgi:hypothetical protein